MRVASVDQGVNDVTVKATGSPGEGFRFNLQQLPIEFVSGRGGQYGVAFGQRAPLRTKSYDRSIHASFSQFSE